MLEKKWEKTTILSYLHNKILFTGKKNILESRFFIIHKHVFINYYNPFHMIFLEVSSIWLVMSKLAT